MVQFIFQIAWVSGATIGALAGSTLPIERVQGLDFALTALFVVLAIDAYRARPDPTRPDPTRSWPWLPPAAPSLRGSSRRGRSLVWAFLGYAVFLVGRLGLAKSRRADD